MTFVDVCRKIVSEKQAHLIRERKGEPNQFDCKSTGIGRKGGWMLVDLFSASAVVKVYDALNPENKAKLDKMHPVFAVNVCMKMVK